MEKEVAVALINLGGSLLWPAVAVFGIIFVVKSLESGWLQRVLPDGGTISLGDAKLSISRSIRDAESAVDKISAVPKEAFVSEAEEKFDEESDPYDLVMDTWYALADAITAFAVIHGGADDRRRVWENLERLVDRGKLLEAEKGAVRDLQKARNSIRRLGSVDRVTAEKFAETARRLTASFVNMVEVK